TEAPATALLPDLIPTPYWEIRDRFPWSLRPAKRKQVLGEMRTASVLQKALEANAAPDTLLQRILSSAINSHPFSLTELTYDELTALGIVVNWMEGTDLVSQLPTPGAVREQIERQRERNTLVRLVGDHFTNREAELEILRSHI